MYNWASRSVVLYVGSILMVGSVGEVSTVPVSCGSVHVAFVASRASTTRSGRIHFRNEVINEGGAWDPLHAEFVAPVEGLYQLYYSALPGGLQVLSVQMRRNNDTLLRGYGDRQVSGQQLVHLSVRDRVWLQMTSGALFEDPNQLMHAYTVLGGHLVSSASSSRAPCSGHLPAKASAAIKPLVIGRLLPAQITSTTKQLLTSSTLAPPLYRPPHSVRLSPPSSSALSLAVPLSSLSSIIRRVQTATSELNSVVLPSTD